MSFNFQWGVIKKTTVRRKKKISVKDLKVNELAIWISGGNTPESGTGQCESPKPGAWLENRKESSVTTVG